MKNVILLALVAFAAAQRVRYDGYSVWTVHTSDVSFVKNSIAKHGLDVISKAKGSIDFVLSPIQQAKFRTDLLHAGIDYEVRFANIQDQIDRDYHQLDIQPKIYSPAQFNTWTDIDAKMQQVAADVPSASLVNIGTTFEGRPLQYLRFSTGGGKQAVWIDSGIHAREWMAVSVGLDSIERIEAGDDTEMNALLDRYDVHIMPVVNPDGYAHTHDSDRMWRKNRAPTNTGVNCTGTDLNRNFAFRWNFGGSSEAGCSDTYMGDSAGSEQETQAVQSQLSSVDEDYIALISHHAEGYMMMYAMGHTCVNITDQADVDPPAQQGSDDAFAVRGGRFAVGSICNVIYEASGNTVDYAYGQANIKYSYTTEVADGAWLTFRPPVEEIVPTRQETWALAYGTLMAIP